MRNPLIHLALIAFLPACLSELPQPSKIDKLRVLAVAADRPEVLPGETIELTALVVGEAAEDISYDWRACLLPEQGRGFFSGGSESGASGGHSYSLESVGTCHGLAEFDPEAVIDLGTGPSATLTLPEDLLSDEVIGEVYGLGAADLPEIVLLALRMVAGVNFTVSLRVKSGDEVVNAFKRINISLSPEPNANPTNAAFTLREGEEVYAGPEEGTPATPGSCLLEPLELGKGVFSLHPLNVPDPPVAYEVIAGTTDPEKPFDLIETEETLYFSFFSTHGSFSRNITKSQGPSEVVWRFEDAPTGTVPLWIVVRDGRGGTTWCHSLL